MDLSDYQRLAQETDQFPLRIDPDDPESGLLVPLLGMAGELGSLQAEYKKRLRDGEAHRLFKEQFAEEIGDILWYLANLASKMDLDLSAIAQENLAKTRDRWPPDASPRRQLLDERFPRHEQFPRRFVAEIREIETDQLRAVLTIDGVEVGSRIADNAHTDDGYRFHDVFHLANVAILGWSPVLRGLMKRKRKSDPKIDDAEDGGRAIVIDETVVAFVFQYARRHDFLREVKTVDYSLLKTMKQLVAEFEVGYCTTHEIEQAILAGYRAWNRIRDARGGVLDVDLEERSIVVRPHA
jgi:NTP pyrophosphatase (non-canonical NTP hydrolase)